MYPYIHRNIIQIYYVLYGMDALIVFSTGYVWQFDFSLFLRNKAPPYWTLAQVGDKNIWESFNYSVYSPGKIWWLTELFL